MLITADDTRVASGCEGGDVFLHNLHSSHHEASLSLHRDADLPQEDVRPRSAQPPAAAATRQAGRCMRLPPLPACVGAPQGVTCLAFSPVRPHLLAVSTRLGSVLVWNTSSREVHALYRRSHTAPVRGLCWSPVNQLLLASGAEDKRVLFYDVDKGRCDPCCADAGFGECTSPALTPGHRMVQSLQAPDPVSSMDFHYDGATLAAGTTTGARGSGG